MRLYGVAIEREPMMIVMELVNGGALDEYVRKNVVTVDEKLNCMTAGAAWGLE